MATPIASKVLVLFMDGEIRTLEEIQEWTVAFMRPEQCYRAWKRKTRSEPPSLEHAIREGGKWIVRETLRYLIWERGWIEEVDGKLAEGYTAVDGDYSFRLTSAGREMLREKPRSGVGLKTRIWNLMQELYDNGQIRVQLRAPDGSHITAACLKNGKTQSLDLGSEEE